ncbi:MAG TPA: hypothetical protein PK127_04215 [Clostridiales bacterium]|nr:hypothetical protein [Clostridiales bacterium]HPV01664.1 hypothetical protein [Clostridiales bacterium]
MAEPRRSFVERRKGPDAVVKAVWWTAGISWLLFITALIFVETARPEVETFFDRQFNISIRDHWDENALLYVFIILVLNFAVCTMGFIFNLARHRRKTDRFNKSILIIGTLSLAGILWYLFR